MDFRRYRIPSTQAIVVALLCAALGSCLGLLIVPRAPTPGDTHEPAPEVRLLGESLALDDGAVETAIERVRRFSTRRFTLALPGENYHTFGLSELGAEIDTARLSKLVLDARNPDSALRSLWRRIAEGEIEPERDAEGTSRVHDLPVPIAVDSEVALASLMRLKDDFDRLPESARLNLDERTVLPHVTGRFLDVDATVAAIEQSLAAGELRAEVQFTTKEPHRRSSELSSIDFGHVLGHFETTYSRSSKYADRTFNLRLAASKLDGTVLMPGEVFDFNQVVGPRDEANGYKVATVIADGELVDGIGGGTCQISGTLHGAAFFAGLDVVERYPHTRPSSYIKMGMDATVVYPTINFRLRNPYEFPIVLHETVKGGKVRAEVLGRQVDQVVTLIRKVDEALPYEQIERPDDRLPRGHSVLAQRGIPGFRLHRYRVIRRGSHTVRERWRDIYPPTSQVVRVGTGSAADKSSMSGVGTPEYVADELLVMTLTRSEDGSPGEFAENRVKGKYGERGWTQEAGMPFWDGD